MPKKLTTSQKTAIAKAQVKTRILVCITIDENTSIRILENDTLAVLTIGGKQYFAGMVKRGDLQTSNGNEIEKMQITISNILQEISGIIANEGDVLTNKDCVVSEVIYDVVTNTILDNPILIFAGKVNSLVLNASTFQFNVERSMGGYSTASPNATYDVNCQVKKFKDVRCGYTGSATKCDKTLSSCIALGNYLNFYGFPTIPQEMVVRN